MSFLDIFRKKKKVEMEENKEAVTTTVITSPPTYRVRLTVIFNAPVDSFPRWEFAIPYYKNKSMFAHYHKFCKWYHNRESESFLFETTEGLYLIKRSNVWSFTIIKEEIKNA